MTKKIVLMACFKSNFDLKQAIFYLKEKNTVAIFFMKFELTLHKI